MRTFEVAEFDDGEFSGGGASGRGIGGGDFGEVIGERILGHVANFSAKHEAGVFGNVDSSLLVLSCMVNGNRNFEQVRNVGGSDWAEIDFVFGSPAEKIAEVGFDFGEELLVLRRRSELR